jgi:serine/threonine-protein kinase
VNECEIFVEALRKPAPADREAFLDKACGSDPPLRKRLAELLAAHARAGGFLNSPVAAGAFTVELPHGESPGTVIGPYKLIEQIGEGGFGVVFMAEQQRPVRRKVAFKIVKPGMDTKQVVARFEAERQALAMMDHPNIARVLDGGATDSGRPYFVMDLVRGLPITEYCDQNQLPAPKRLELFIAVCQAVQHAHQRGIIHRDLKPSNVLVTLHDGMPIVKVIDFGIAKALGQQLTDKTLVTGFAQMVGTPLYMSPEQAEQSGQDMDTRSDIYSLGVILYELLTGTTPFEKQRLHQVGYDEMRRIIREEEPPKPSTRLSTMEQANLSTIAEKRGLEAQHLSQQVRGELDWIVMKALEKDRNRRYETASAFAADVRHYLNDEPVQACPPSTLYTMRKFARRRKSALAMASCVILALAGIASAVGWAVRDRAARDRDQQVRDAALDDEVNRALDEAVKLIEDCKWPLAQAAVERVEKLLTAAARQQLPPRLAELQNDLALAQRLEDIYSQPKTEDFLWGPEPDAAYAAAFTNAGIDVANLSALEAAEHIRARSIRRELVRALDLWSLMRRRVEYHGGGARDWKRLLEIAAGADADSWRNQLRRARINADRQALESLALSPDIGQRAPESLLLLATALEESVGQEPAITVARQAVLVYPDDWWLNMFVAYWSLIAQPPQYDEVIRYSMACQAIRPRNPYNLCNLGRALYAKRAYAEAAATFSRAIGLKPDHWEAWWRRAEAYVKSGQRDKALADYTHVIEQNPAEAWSWHKRGWGHAYGEPPEYDKAIADFNEAIKLNPKFAWAWYDRGWVHIQLNQFDRAVAALDRAIELDPSHPSSWTNRGHAHNHLQRYHEALSDLTKAIKLDPKDTEAWSNRGWTYLELEQWDNALADINRALQLDPKSAGAWRDRGTIHVGLRQYHQALADYAKAAALNPKLAMYRHLQAWLLATCPDAKFRDAAKAVRLAMQAVELSPKDARYWSMLAVAYLRAGNEKDAITALNKARQLGPEAEPVAGFLLATAHWQLGEQEKARASYYQAVQSMDQHQETRRYRAQAAELLKIKE